ncbi:MAG: hypothetical protein J2P57_13405, partial [Acidimicrobiaceae bacterium]|nr:hypothetical protein [Acidimicrobiaceae bacterium]
LDAMLGEADAGLVAWERHAPVPVPGAQPAEARSAPFAQTLGWLVAIGAGQVHAEVGASLRWLGQIAVWGTELAAEGRVVPVLRSSGASQSNTKPAPAGKSPAAKPAGRGNLSRQRVRWAPVLVARDRLQDLVSWMPGSVVALQTAPQPDGVCRSVLTAVVDAIGRAGAARLVAPAVPPQPSTRSEIGEAVLASLDGRAFSAEHEPAARVAEDLKRWASPVTTSSRIGLTVRLDPPADDGGWRLSVEATGVDKHPLPVEHAMVVGSGAKSQQVEAALRRLERLVPALRRPTTRRGQVVLDGEEASELMFHTGPSLQAAGFDVLLPMVSRSRPSPRLRLFTEALGGKSQVGVQQLANVRWSVLFDDLELDAAEVAKLTAEARPLVQVRGRWVRIDRADLAAAAAALAERSAINQLSGAAVLRHAVGLEGSPFGGPVLVEGSGWAADLLRGVSVDPPGPIADPEGFVGHLRSYQAEAAGWLAFLDRADLGGCLAMDMGLGKTPTLLAHLQIDRGHGPALVICPPAVLTNWAEEAERFTPDLRVAVHHGPRRADGDTLTNLASRADIVLTTYATAVRDVDDLAAIEWRRVVVDEAQTIKNAQSDTAQTLRRLPSRRRLALTGTPVENGLGDLWAILDFTNPGLVGPRNAFIEHLSRDDDGGAKGASAPEEALRALNGLLIFRRTKNEPEIAAELPDKVDKLDHCAMTTEQIGLYQAVVDRLLDGGLAEDTNARKGQVLAAITALKQICDHPAAYLGEDEGGIEGRSGKLTRLEEIVDDVFAAGEKLLVFTHFARWGERLAAHLTERLGERVGCYHGGLARGTRDRLIAQFQEHEGPAVLVLSIKAGGSGLNLTAANHVVLYDRWWNPAVEDQARDRAWRIGQLSTVVSHRLVCPGTVDERVEEIVAGKRRVAGMVLPARSSLGDLDANQLRVALGLKPEELIDDEPTGDASEEEAA